MSKLIEKQKFEVTLEKRLHAEREKVFAEREKLEEKRMKQSQLEQQQLPTLRSQQYMPQQHYQMLPPPSTPAGATATMSSSTAGVLPPGSPYNVSGHMSPVGIPPVINHHYHGPDGGISTTFGQSRTAPRRPEIINEIDSELESIREQHRIRFSREVEERNRLEKQLKHEAAEREKLERKLQLERTQDRATLERKLEQERTLHLQQLEQDRALHAASLVQTQNELNSVRAMMDPIQSAGMAGILRVKDAVMQFADLVKSIGTGQRTRPF